MSDATYLVFLGTSKQGRATIDALASKGCKSIVATSRNPDPKRFGDAVSKVLPADFADPESIKAAIKESQASRIWFTTDWYAISKPTREKEFLLGKSVIDAVLEVNKEKQQVKHIVYSSVGNATTAHENVEHFRSKGEIGRAHV